MFKKNVLVIDGQTYLMNVVNMMMELLAAETSISGNGLRMLDMVGNFSGYGFHYAVDFLELFFVLGSKHSI
jgi:hypothetical protein